MRRQKYNSRIPVPERLLAFLLALIMLAAMLPEFSVNAIENEDGLTPLAGGTDSSFNLTYSYDGQEYAITFNIVDTNGDPIAGDYSDLTAEAATRYIFGERDASTSETDPVKDNIVPTIEGYTYQGATTVAGNGSTYAVCSVATSAYNNTVGGNVGQLRFYTTEPLTDKQYLSFDAGDWTVTLTYAAEEKPYEGSSFNVTYNGCVMTVNLVDHDGNPLSTQVTNINAAASGTYSFADLAPEIEGYRYDHAVDVTSGAAVITAGTNVGGYPFRLYNETGGFYSRDKDFAVNLLYSEPDALYYDLNLTELAKKHVLSSGSWKMNNAQCTGPNLVTSVQKAADGSTLYTVLGGRDDDGYFTYCGPESIDGIRNKMYAEGKPYGKQLRFDGWEAEDVDGNACLFPEGAEMSVDEQGVRIVDASGQERVVPEGATFVGKWTEISDLVQFYVNYTGTILDTEGDVKGRNQGHFTPIIAIGHVYYGYVQAGSDSVFGSDADKQIRVDFTYQFDPDNPNAQIVMDYITEYTDDGDNIYVPAGGINDSVLEEHLMAYIRSSPDITIRVSSANKDENGYYINPAIETENATTDNYSVRWYVLKEQSDSWHIDGVMVARTEEINVTKTFSGLTQDQVDQILQADSDEGYNMPVKLGTDRQEYLTMTTQGIAGQYAYQGQEKDAGSPAGQSYHWTLNAINNEQYTLSEEAYELEGYDVSTITINYYKDADGRTQIAYGYEPTTQGLDREVFGGETTAVTFNNFYTPAGTGALAIHKSSSNKTGESDVGSALKGAEFTLYQNDGTTVEGTSTTNVRGSAYFDGLKPGSYILKETQAPDGYYQNENTWTVVVETNDTTGNVTVTVYQNDSDGVMLANDGGVVCYDGGIKQSYGITDDPKAGTVRVTKVFSGLTTQQMETIAQRSYEGGEDPYYIWMQGNISGTGEIDAGMSTNVELYLHDAIRGQDGFTFTWTVANLAMERGEGEDKKAIYYQISEHNYLSSVYQDTEAFQAAGSYKDTVVTAAVNGEAKEVTVDRLDSGTVADISKVTFEPERSDTVELTNHYTNTFTLTLQKIDSETQAPLPNAVFDVYGPYREAVDASRQITYKDPDSGRTRTAYYIDTITADENGIAVKENLNLSDSGSTFVYIINESFAPDGYAPLDEPIVQTVTVDTDGYAHGVYTADVVNYLKANAHLDVTAAKEWDSGRTTAVTLELYRRAEGSEYAQLVGTAVLDGTQDAQITDMRGEEEGTGRLSDDGWSYAWTGLDAYEDSGGEAKRYTYYVREQPVAGYTTQYSGALVELVLEDGVEVQAVPAEGNAQHQSVTVTNSILWEIPSVGGNGIYWPMAGGVLCMCFAAGVLLLSRQPQRGKRVKGGGRR